jgi:precorrin-2 dehydrogenase/sirohydrochlorin ferrochelatase
LPRYYPAFIDVNQRRCVVIGGGHEGQKNVEKLLDCDAQVVVISPEVTDSVAEMANQNAIVWRQRQYQIGDLEGMFIAIAATDDNTVNRQVAKEAEERNVLLNVVDVTHLCTFIAPSVARRGEVTIATSTGGASPALARTFREKLTSSRILQYADLAPILAQARAELREKNVKVAPDDWQTQITDDLLDMVQADKHDEAYKILMDGLLTEATPIAVS